MFLISIFLFIIFLSPSRHSASYDGYFYIVLLLGKNFGLAYPYDVKPQKEYRSIFLRHIDPPPEKYAIEKFVFLT